MEFDDFLGKPRWQILELIAKEPSSPVAIAQKIGTSIAYVSQQLKILEAANLVEKKRTRAVDKGQPRLIYSIKEDTIQITSLIQHSPAKKKILPNQHQKNIMKIWMVEDSSLHYYLEKLYWRLEPYLKEIKSIFLDSGSKKPRVIVSSTNKKLGAIVSAYSKDTENALDCEILVNFNIKKNDPTKFYAIYETEENPKKIEVKNEI